MPKSKTKKQRAPKKQPARVKRTTIEQLRERIGFITKSHHPDYYDAAEKSVLACAEFIVQEAAAIGRVLAGQAEPVSTCACSFSEIEEANRLMQHYASRAVAIEDFSCASGSQLELAPAKKEDDDKERCSKCGGTDLQYLAWVGANDNELVDSDESYSGYYCPTCDQHNVRSTR